MFAQTRAYPYPKMSHAIPLRLFHDLNCDRWNCNVFSGPKKSEGTQIACDFWGDEAGVEGRGRAGFAGALVAGGNAVGVDSEAQGRRMGSSVRV